MIKFQAFDDPESYSEDSDVSSNQITREAQEESLNKLYYDGLQAAAKGDKSEAIELLTELKYKLENGSCIIHDTVHLERLKYLTYKNIGLFTDDLKSILQALEIDSSDFNLWIAAGRKSKEEYKFLVSKNCFETAFKQNSQNIIAIENLIEIYYIINDFYDCANMCLFALKQDSKYYKALILLNECLSWDKLLMKDFDRDYLQFVSNKYGGKLDMEGLLNQTNFEIYRSNILKKLTKDKNELFKHNDEVESNKKKEFILQAKDCVNLKEIATIILNFYYSIKQQGLSICSKIIFENEQSSIECVTIDEDSNKQNQEICFQASQASQDLDSIESQQSKENNSDFNLADFVDKRRSTRNKKIFKADEIVVEKKSELEKLLDLFPRSLKKHSNCSQLLSKESSQFSNVSQDNKDENRTLTKEFLNDLCDEFKSKSNKMNIFQLIRFYLIKLSLFKNCMIPEEFYTLYKIYRNFQPLPCPYDAKIPDDISIELIHVCLTANEFQYDPIESSFLQEMMGRLSEKLSLEEYRHFIVRLQVLLGNAKWDPDHLLYARDLCKAKPQFDFVFGMEIPDDGQDIQVIASNQQIIDINYLDNALEMLSFTSDNEQLIHFKEIIRSYFTKPEINLTKENKDDLCDSIIELKIWEKGINLIETWNDLSDNCFELIYHCVVQNGIKVSPNLAKKVAKKALEGKCFKIWKILQYILQAENCDEQTMANFYVIAHSSLAKNGLCTTDCGEFLLQACDTLHKSDFYDDAENIYACLFNYPPKKRDHASNEITLEWIHCKDIFNFFFYEALPEYDSNKETISPDEKDLLIRMLRLIPEEFTPVKCSEHIRNHIEKGMPLDENFRKRIPVVNDITSYIYYYLADYFFKKDKDFTSAKLYYIFDLTLNCNRFDSWAGLALSINYEIDQMHTSACPVLEDYVKKVFATSQCFEQALMINNCDKLRVEYGLLMYSFANFISRQRKLQILFKKQIYIVPKFNNQMLEQMFNYEYVLQKAKRCFEILYESEELEEPWLVNYMLGKISEKNIYNILKTLQYYERSSQLLYLNGAPYPKKIQYVNNRYPALSIEALEIHYRIHSSILKYLYRNSKFSARNLRKIKLFLIKTNKSPFITRKQYSEKKTKIIEDDCDFQVSECLNDLLDIVYEREKAFDVNTYRRDLIVLCKKGILTCFERFPNHYKAYYRYADEADPKTAFDLLLGTTHQNRQNPLLCLSGEGKKSSSNVISGLFCFEKGFFINVWRLSVEEIERSGKFSAHIFRLINLLVETCRKLEDWHTLGMLYKFLQKSPEPDKRFLNEPERVALTDKSKNACLSIANLMPQKLKNQEIKPEEFTKFYQQITYLLKR